MERYHGHLIFDEHREWFCDWFTDTDNGEHSRSILATGRSEQFLSAAMLGWVSHTISQGASFILAANRDICLDAGKLAVTRGYDVFASTRERTGAELVKKMGKRPMAIIVFIGEFESDNRIGNEIISSLLGEVVEMGSSRPLAVFIEELPRFGAIAHLEQAVLLSQSTRLRFGLTAQKCSDVYDTYPSTSAQITESCLLLN